MPIRNLDQLVNHLEQGAADELAQLEAVGVAFYSTEQLLRLRGQWEVKNELFHYFQRLIVKVVAFSPVWLLLWGIAHWLQWTLLSLFFLSLFPLSFFLFFFGLWFMYRFFKGKGHLDRVGEDIAIELTRRKEAGGTVF